VRRENERGRKGGDELDDLVEQEEFREGRDVHRDCRLRYWMVLRRADLEAVVRIQIVGLSR